MKDRYSVRAMRLFLLVDLFPGQNPFKIELIETNFDK
jgi:hypothetical protein